MYSPAQSAIHQSMFHACPNPTPFAAAQCIPASPLLVKQATKKNQTATDAATAAGRAVGKRIESSEMPPNFVPHASEERRQIKGEGERCSSSDGPEEEKALFCLVRLADEPA